MLILCEKPSVAKDFAAALGASFKKGYYQSDNLVITYCVGHLFELYEPEDYDPKYTKWRLEDLPIIPENFLYNLNAATKEQTKIVQELISRHAKDDVLIATDAGREGELIARIAMQEAGIKDINRFKRFWVSQALTKDIILTGIKEAKPLAEYDSLAAQGFARQRADWLVGMNLSRFMSIGNPPPPFSVGRVQTAVLSVIAARNAEVKNFCAVPYKELELLVTSKDGVTIKALLENPKTGKTSFFNSDDEAYLATTYKYCSDTKPLSINSTEVKSVEKKQKPPKLLNITALQKAAYKQFSYTPDETLNIAQALYETHKCLSYPRTPSRVLGDDNVELFKEKFELLKHNFIFSGVCDISLITVENKHIFNSAKLEDHHALILLAPLPNTANEKEKNIYNIVLDSFFIVCMPDFIYNEKSIRFNIAQYAFNSKIKEVIQAGWKQAGANNVTDIEANIEAKEEQEVPAFDEKDCSVSDCKILKKKTSPKKEFAIDTLLAFMEHPHGDEEGKHAGLGTPATRAEIIKTLFSRQYIHEEKKRLYATERGQFLITQLLQNSELAKMASVAQTTEWEQKLLSDPFAFEKDIAAYISRCVKTDTHRATFQNKPLGKCPLCGKAVTENKMAYGCAGYKDESKCNFAI